MLSLRHRPPIWPLKSGWLQGIRPGGA